MLSLNHQSNLLRPPAQASTAASGSRSSAAAQGDGTLAEAPALPPSAHNI